MVAVADSSCSAAATDDGAASAAAASAADGAASATADDGAVAASELQDIELGGGGPTAPRRSCGSRVLRYIRSTRRYFEPLAVLEATVAIMSGVLIWMGFWDLVEEIIPDTWYNKLLMILVGLMGMVSTRTLYDKEMLQAIRMSNGLGPRPDSRLNANLLTGTTSEMVAPVETTPCSPPGARAPSANGSSGGAGPVSPKRSATNAPAETRRQYFNPPPLSCSRCTRSLLAVFIGLTVWVGVWDLVDYHLLPAISGKLNCDPHNSTCALVKLGLVVLGALGLFMTRSLYGDKDVHSAQFQRFQ